MQPLKAIKKRARLVQQKLDQRLNLRGEFVSRATRPGDIFLVSYPKSGNTWVRFLLANLLWQDQLTVDFRSINALVPPVTVLHRHGQLPPPRLVKSHAPFQPTYPRTIYLLRDGRDTMVSYYHYELKRGTLPPETTLADYLRRTDHWPCPWATHVASWLDAGLPAGRLLLLRYERMKQDPAGVLQQMLDFIGLTATPAQIAQAVDNASFDAMRRLEAQSGGPRSMAHSGFIRRGQAGGWRDELGTAERDILKPQMNDMLIRLGYASDGAW